MAIQVVFICNEEQEDFLPDNILIVSNRASLDAVLSKSKLSEALSYYWIILAELQWENTSSYYVNFWGLDLIAKLRIEEKIKNPIILTSYCPIMTPQGLSFNHKVEVKSFRYLRDPLVKFVPIFDLFQLTYPDLLLSFDEPLEDQVLFQDLAESLYKTEGYLSNFFHDTMNELLSFSDSILSMLSTKAFLNNKISQLGNFIQDTGLISEIKKESLDFLAQKTIFDKKKIFDFLSTLQHKTLRNYTDSKAYELSALPPKVTILYIGDQQDVASDFPKRLEKLNINCKTATNIEEAVIQLKKYKINVVITNFRFYSPDGRFQRLQGYHIIEEIHQRIPNFYCMIMLTNFDLSYLPQFLPNRKILQFNKDQILANDPPFAKFAQLLIGQDAIIWDRRKGLPNFFNDFVLGLYTLHLESDNFDREEEQISIFALDFIATFIKHKKVAPINGAFGNLSPSLPKERNIENLRMKLKLRRIALGLFQVRPSHLNGLDLHRDFFNYLYQLISSGQVNKNSTSVASGTIYSFQSKHLLKMKTRNNFHWKNCDNIDIPLTPLERKWIKKHGQSIENNSI